MRVLLISVNRERNPYPVAPLGLGYVASALRAAGHEPRILDLCFSQDIRADIQRAVAEFRPQVAGLSLRNLDNVCMVAPVSYLDDLKAPFEIVRELGVPHIALGGSGFSLVPEGVLEYCGADLGCVGEGERAVPVLCDRLAAGEGVDDVPGLVRRVDGRFVRAPAEHLPWDRLQRRPARDLMDVDRYLRLGGMANLQTKRGCPFHCVYCTYPLLEGHGLRLRDVDDVVDEIQELVGGYGADYIYFVDDVFSAPPQYAARICRAIVERGLKFNWTGFVNPSCIDEPLLRLMHSAGCDGVEFGLDVASDAMLERLGKGFTAAQILEASAACKRAYMPFAHYLLLGGPGENEETIRQTLDVMDRTEANAVICAAGMRIYPGTDLHRTAVEEGVVLATDSLLTPKFYFSADMTARLMERVHAHAETRDNWMIVGLHDEAMRSVLALAREYGMRGPLWNFLAQFRRRERKKAARHARDKNADPVADSQAAESQGGPP
jgi:radical SAM superfamily enzyme YgiQ (UPF0313 family)